MCFICTGFRPTTSLMNLTQCPYDGAQVEAGITEPDHALQLRCVACGAAWERRGGRVTRVRKPDSQRFAAARRQGGPGPGPEPLPMAVTVEAGGPTQMQDPA